MDVDSKSVESVDKNEDQLREEDMKNFLHSCKKIILCIWRSCGEIISFATMIVMIFTLQEDIVTRNSAYMPLLKMESEVENYKFELSWNREKEISSVSDLPELSFPLYNIGNGVANNVRVELDQEMLRKLIEQLKNLGSDVDYKKLINESCTYISWITNNPDVPKIVNIPSAYLECLREICKWQDITNNGPIDLPVMEFKIKCEDIQGKPVEYAYSIYDEISFEEYPCVSVDNEGNVTRRFSLRIEAGKRIR